MMTVRMDLSVEFNDGVENWNDYADLEGSSDLTDTDENDEEFVSMVTATAVELVVPRCFKRTYGVFVDGEVVVPERRSRSRIQGQFESLRAVIPNLCTDEKAAILTDACKYIEQLQRQVAQLYNEVGAEYSDCEDELSCCEDDQLSPSFREGERAADSSMSGLESSSESYCGCTQPTVEVVRTEEGLKIHIECDKLPGLLLEIMKLLESRGLNVEDASISCMDRIVFDGVGSEVDGNDGGENIYDNMSAEVVEACLRSLISNQRQGSSEQEA